MIKTNLIAMSDKFSSMQALKIKVISFRAARHDSMLLLMLQSFNRVGLCGSQHSIAYGQYNNYKH